MARGTTILEDRARSKKVGALRGLVPFLAPYRGMVVLALLALMLTATISLILPLAVRRVVDGFGGDNAALLDQYFAAALVIPPGFGRDLAAGRAPEIGVWLDGSNTTRAETGRGYVQGVIADHLRDVVRRETGAALTAAPLVEPRFRYNQAFRSQFAIPPGVLMLVMMKIGRAHV